MVKFAYCVSFFFFRNHIFVENIMMATPQARNNIVKKFLHCRICMQAFGVKTRIPKILGCMHTFCEPCIKTITQSKPYALCPYCKQEWKIPFSGFPNNTLVTNFIAKRGSVNGGFILRRVICENAGCYNDASGYSDDWGMNVCQTCINLHKLMNISAIQRNENPSVSTEKKQNGKREPAPQPQCPNHPKQFLTVYCSTCSLVTCPKCFKTSHHGHQQADVQVAVHQTKTKVASLRKQCQERKKPITNLLSSFDSHIANIDKVHEQKINDIDGTFHSLVKSLQEQREKAIEEVRQLCHSKKQILKDQQKEVQSLCSEYESASDFAGQLCRFSDVEQLFDLQQQVCEMISL